MHVPNSYDKFHCGKNAQLRNRAVHLSPLLSTIVINTCHALGRLCGILQYSLVNSLLSRSMANILDPSIFPGNAANTLQLLVEATAQRETELQRCSLTADHSDTEEENGSDSPIFDMFYEVGGQILST